MLSPWCSRTQVQANQLIAAAMQIEIDIGC
jgi:hypothetical protein